MILAGSFEPGARLSQIRLAKQLRVVDVGLNKYQADSHTLVVLPAGVVHQNKNSVTGVERHITILAPHLADGERLDTPVAIQHEKAFGQL